MTPKQLLTRMQDGEIPERRIEGTREVWRVQGQACGPAVKTLLARGLADGHYPTKGGFLYLTDAGKAAR